MKTKLIELLNKLIGKGWSPFGYHEWKYWYNEIEYFNNELTLSFGEWAWKFIKTYSLRNISSIDSWLWQFICENGMIDEDKCWITDYNRHKRVKDDNKSNDTADYEYRLIESALCDEDKLEQFLISNIHIDE